MTNMDSQDIEEFLITAGPVTVQYTNQNQITALSKTITIQDREEHHISDEELCASTSEETTVQQNTPQTLKHPAQDKLSNTDDQLPEKVKKQSNTAETTSTAQTTTTSTAQNTTSEDITQDRKLPVPCLPSKKDDKPKKSTHKK